MLYTTWHMHNGQEVLLFTEALAFPLILIEAISSHIHGRMPMHVGCALSYCLNTMGFRYGSLGACTCTCMSPGLIESFLNGDGSFHLSFSPCVILDITCHQC